MSSDFFPVAAVIGFSLLMFTNDLLLSVSGVPSVPAVFLYMVPKQKSLGVEWFVVTHSLTSGLDVLTLLSSKVPHFHSLTMQCYGTVIDLNLLNASIYSGPQGLKGQGCSFSLIYKA